MIIQIPFPGFYESMLSSEMDNEESQFVESWLEENPDIKESELDFWRFSNHCNVYDAIAKDWTYHFNETIGLDLGLEYSDMSSPREYNFETDRVFARISEESVMKLWNMTDKDELRKVMRNRHTSYSGFYSHYSNDLNDWPESPLDWDHNQLMTLLIANIPDYDHWEVFESMTYCDGFYKYWQDCVDWNSFKSHIKEIRDEREANDRRAKPLPRCTQTIEMF